MKRLWGVLSVALLCTACVDNDYDLSRVSTDDIAIGNSESEFRIPLATFNYPLTAVTSDGGDTHADAVFQETDTWLPTSATSGSVDVGRLASDKAYRDAYLDQLFDEFATNKAKLEAVAQLVSDKYPNSFNRYMQSSIAQEAMRDQIERLYNDAAYRNQVLDALRKIADGYLGEIRLDTISYKINKIDLGKDVVDMITSNIDGKDGDALYIYGTLTNSYPIDFTITPSFTQTSISFGSLQAAFGKSVAIAQTRITSDDLRTIIDGGSSIEFPIQLRSYYPQKFNKSNTFTITLYLLKKGALKLNN